MDDTIFVSIPDDSLSFNNNFRLVNVLKNLFSNAYGPHRIFVGICSLVSDDSKKESLVEYFCRSGSNELSFTRNPSNFFASNVREKTVFEEHWKGKNVARAYIEKNLYGKEKYFLMIDLDSVQNFVPHWDKYLIQTLIHCPSERPILTTPPKIRDLNSSSYKCFWSPSFSFTYATAHLEVPYDPYLRNLFDGGEEIIMSARFWTYGWDFYVPGTTTVFLDECRRKMIQKKKNSNNSKTRIEYLLKTFLPRGRHTFSPHPRILKEIEKYSLGPYRSLQDYEVFAKK